MEGICGVVSFGSSPPELLRQVDTMAASLSDGEPVDIQRISGEHCVLACTAWVEPGLEPMSLAYEDDSVLLVGVGEIYNLQQLAADLGTPPEFGQVLAEGYRLYSVNLSQKVRGNFAAIIFDLTSQCLLAVTDRVGVRPLYWYKRGDVYFLSSRVRSIASVVGGLEMDTNAIYAYMQHSMIPSPMTIYKNVHKIEPGFLLQADRSTARLVRYWDISATPKLSGNEEEIAGQVYDCIESAVRVMETGTSAMENLGCFLSGGTDSSTICGLLSKIRNGSLAAYSIGFPEDGYDEMFYARVAASAFKLRHRESYVYPEHVLRLLPAIVSAYDEPFANASALPTYRCAQVAAAEGVHYLVAGDGGDEIFAGNERYATQQLFRRYYQIPRVVRDWLLEPVILDRLERLPGRMFRRAGSYISRAKMTDLERLYSYRYVTDSEMFSRSFLESCDREEVAKLPERHFTQLHDADTLDRELYLDMKLTITDNDLRKVTRMCELAQVRVRYPMLDHEVIELGFRIPANLKLRGTRGLRYIFKKAFCNVLPREIQEKKKHGFGLPISQWLRNEPEIRQLAFGLLFDSRHLRRGYFRPDWVRKVWDLQFQDKTPYYGAIIWQLVMLEAWHLVHMDGESLPL